MPKPVKRRTKAIKNKARRRKDVIERIAELQEWLEKLSPLDRSNFERMISLDNAPLIIAKMDAGNYRDHALVALSLRYLTEAFQADRGED